MIGSSFCFHCSLCRVFRILIALRYTCSLGELRSSAKVNSRMSLIIIQINYGRATFRSFQVLILLRAFTAQARFVWPQANIRLFTVGS